MPSMTPNDMIDAYVKLRDKKQDIEKRHKAELAPLNEMMGSLEAYLLENMRVAGLSSLRGTAGTAYKTLKTSARVVDWPLTLDFILKNQMYDLLEHRVSKLVVQSIMEETKQAVPGVETSQEDSVNVRRATANSKLPSTEEVE